MEDIIAPNDGSPIYIGYEDHVVVSPDGHHRTEWKFKREPPHGDGIFEVSFNRQRLEGVFWGRGHAWSPCSRYFTLESCGSDDSYLLIFRAEDAKASTIGKHLGVRQFTFPSIWISEYGRSEVSETVITKQYHWNQIANRVPETD